VTVFIVTSFFTGSKEKEEKLHDNLMENAMIASGL
jgi:hypothetical protein